ncbi:hypothetical protein CG396_06305, partial [Bifidobacteriaceae bacterium N170]
MVIIRVVLIHDEVEYFIEDLKKQDLL